MVHTSLPNAPYEVEFRCRFASDEEAYATIPFLRESLFRSVGWTDAYYGPEVFERGEVLRFSSTIVRSEVRFFLGWKGVDLGSFANLRQELAEEVTTGIEQSEILALFAGQSGPYPREEIVPALEGTGHNYFMSYAGESALGHYEPLAVNLKLMRCEAIRWPLLVEFEKLAQTEDEAHRFESDLLDICHTYDLSDRLVDEEPGTLLYEQVFGKSPRFLG